MSDSTVAVETPAATVATTTTVSKALLILNCLVLTIGNTAGPLLKRLYFLKGGKLLWLSSWLETAGGPLIFIPLVISYLHRRKESNNASFFTIKLPLSIAVAVVGVMTGFDDYPYSYGMSKLPVSTSALIIASQLAITAVCAYFMVKQKFNFSTLNSIVILTIGACVLALNTDGDRPASESIREYWIGFLMTVGAAVLHGFILPLVEFIYKKSKQPITYHLVLEIQMIISFFATVVCTIGMLVNKEFQMIPIEAKQFESGVANYYVLMASSAFIWQFFFLGAIGVIFSGSSLLSGIIIAVLLPVTEILSVIFFREKFTGPKAVSLALSFWGFVSYTIGEIQENKKKRGPVAAATELTSQDQTS